MKLLQPPRKDNFVHRNFQQIHHTSHTPGSGRVGDRIYLCMHIFGDPAVKLKFCSCATFQNLNVVIAYCVIVLAAMELTLLNMLC